MKPSLRTLALSVVVCLTLACATLTNPQVLLQGRATPTLRADTRLATPEIDDSGASDLATQLAGTLEPETGTELATQLAGTLEPEKEGEATPEGGNTTGSAMATALAATLEAALGSVPGQVDVTPAAPSSSGADPAIRVTNSLELLADTQASPPPLPSFHLEMKQLTPVMSSGAVAQTVETVSADVEGANVHFTDSTTKPGDKPVVTEAYIVGDQNYTIKDGKATPDFGMSSVAWATWPINGELVIGLGTLKTTPAGTETLEGRPAEKYTLGGTSGDDPSGVLSSMGLPVTDVTGEVWVDKATGVLLKAELDYKALATDNGAATKTSGAGRLEITVTQIGQVTVKDPTK
jgi:hypothetical protein